MVHNWATHKPINIDNNLVAGESADRTTRKVETASFLKSFLENLLKLPSHYCRKSTSKLYLETIFSTMSDVYKAYKQCCIEEKKNILSKPSFNKHFQLMNLLIYTPKKDRCNTCIMYETNNLSKEEWLLHICRKDDAQQ